MLKDSVRNKVFTIFFKSS